MLPVMGLLFSLLEENLISTEKRHVPTLGHGLGIGHLTFTVAFMFF